MKVIIIGGGKLGYFLTRNMIDMDYHVKLIEKDKTKCMKISNELDAEVVYGDGTKVEVLVNAGVAKADCLIAVTGRDQDNLVASQLAKNKFKVKKVIARANNPRNLEALRKLGVDNAVSSTEIITRLIEQEIESDGLQLLVTINQGRAAICEIHIPKRAVINGSYVKDIGLPDSSLIVSVVRGDEVIIPKGDTIIEEEDKIVAVCESGKQRELVKIFNEIKKR